MARDNFEPESRAGEADRVGVFGGMFDPPHDGHLVAAQSVLEDLDLDRVLLVPAYSPPHKNDPAASPRQRYRMVQAVCKDNPRFESLDLEIVRGGVSYTVDTLEKLSKQCSEHLLTLVVGADELKNFTKWHRWEKILELSRLTATSRPGLQTSRLLKQLPDKISRNTRTVEIPRLEISSTMLRNRIRSNQSIRYLTPEAVREIIREEELYLD